MARSQADSAAITRVTIATNNGDIGGGEVMMLRIADALRADGCQVTVVAPSDPSAVAEVAHEAGHTVAVLKSRNRAEWMLALRAWDARKRTGMLWCNGLVPAVATAGHRNRIVHLHQRPNGAHNPLAWLARRRANAVVVPSRSMLEGVPGAHVLPNWTEDVSITTRQRQPGDPFVVGFLGRISMDKGVGVLAEAMRMLQQRRPGEFRLALGGESRFSSAADQLAVETALAAVASVTDRLGWVSRADLFGRIDLLVVPSIVRESFGLVAAEAMAARVPVLVSDAGALPEVVGDGHPLVVPAGDAAALADTIEQVAQGSRRADVDGQYERWRGNFSPEAGARRMQSLLQSVSA